MSTLTFDRVLSYAEMLPTDEQAMLEELLHKRRIEAWRKETASEAKTAGKAFRVGTLKSLSAESAIARLRGAL